MGVILGLYRNNGKENGSYYLGIKVWIFVCLAECLGANKTLDCC